MIASPTFRVAVTLSLSLTACKPPPTDADLERAVPEAEPTFASAALPSPDTEGAVWVQTDDPFRIVYGIPGEPALVALQCVRTGAGTDLMQITRISPADEGASALLAVIGNGAIGRIKVDSTQRGNGFVWKGSLPATDPKWEPFSASRQATLTVPGAGMVKLNASPLPSGLLRACRNPPLPE